MTARGGTPAARRAVGPAIALWVLTSVGPGAATPARAEPAFAVRTGYSCGQCHVNRMGGGMRTPFGSVYTQTTLPARLLRWKDRGYFLPADPEARFAFGGDVRAGFYRVGSADAVDTASFELPAANLYGQLRFIPERFSLYLDQRVGSGASSTRELFALLSFPKGRGYVKVGRFLPPYGWALPDDASFVREPLGFAFSASDVGIEVGFEPGAWSAQLALINGNGGARDADRGKKATLLAARRFRRAKIGMSGAADFADGGTTTWAGILGGVNFGRLSFLAEADARRASPDAAAPTKMWTGYFETDVLIRRGMTVKYTHDWIDPSRDVRTDQRQRDAIALEYIPYPFVQLRAVVRRGDGPPQISGTRDMQADLEVHVFF